MHCTSPHREADRVTTEVEPEESNFAVIFGIRKLESRGYRAALRDPTFSLFDTIPECDRQIDRQTQDDGIYRASIAWCGKNWSFHSEAFKGTFIALSDDVTCPADRLSL